MDRREKRRREDENENRGTLGHVSQGFYPQISQEIVLKSQKAPPPSSL
jgi:hypothetical protein